MDIGALAEFLGAWLKELIKTIIAAKDWLTINFGGAADGEADAE